METSPFRKLSSYRGTSEYMEVGMEDEYQSIINKLFYFPIKLRFLHHNTTTYSKHQALGMAYDSLGDLQDDIIEKLIGCSGKRYSSPTVPNCGTYSDDACVQTGKEIKEFARTLKSYAESYGYMDISQQADTYEGVGAKLLYLLTLS